MSTDAPGIYNDMPPLGQCAPTSYHDVLAALPAGVCVVDPSGTVRFMKRALELLRGWPSAHAGTQPHDDTPPPPGGAAFSPLLVKQYRANGKHGESMMVNAKRILLIEDNAVLGDLLCRVLQHAGYAVVLAHDGVTGIKLLEIGNLDLVITDLHMPGRNGFEVLKVATGLGNAPPVLLITGGATLADIELALQTGAVDYLLKPFPLDEFLARITSCFQTRRHRRADAMRPGY